MSRKNQIVKDKVLGVIPARYASTRFPGKPLALIKGRPMIAWVVEASLRSNSIDKLVVATDDERIAQAVQGLCETCMTPSDLPSGTDRVWAAAEKTQFEIIVNIQGDEPLIDPQTITELVAPLKEREDLMMSTLGHQITQEEVNSLNAVKVLVNKKSEAIYFSRFPIPFSREKDFALAHPKVLKHIGLYGYRREFLQSFCKEKPSFFEYSEGLEQLRALDMGAKIFVGTTQFRSWGVDTPEDLTRVEKLMEGQDG